MRTGLSPNRNRRDWWMGLRDAAPVILGYAPLAVAYGVLGVQAGLPVHTVIAMSAMVYAGASQFMAVGMIAAGGTLAAIVITTLIVNLRHVLMSAAISPQLGITHPLRLTAIGFHLTDETFAMMSAQARSKDLSPAWVRGLQWGSYLSWVIGSATGAILGGAVVDPTKWGLDYALVAMFVALLVLQARTGRLVAVACIAAVVYKVSAIFLPAHWCVVLATIVAATAGSLVFHRHADEKQEESSQAGPPREPRECAL